MRLKAQTIRNSNQPEEEKYRERWFWNASKFILLENVNNFCYSLLFSGLDFLTLLVPQAEPIYSKNQEVFRLR